MEVFFGILLTVCFSGAYIPQIIKIIRNRSSNDVSFIMLLVNFVGYSAGLLYVIFQRNPGFWLWVNYSLGLIATFICMIIWRIYND
tara:strand:- start:927 stop:1184 length:258 start_codon:yes stop_codon:yes gene_type:complete